MTDLEILKILLFIVAKKNGGQIVIDNIDIYKHFAKEGDVLDIKQNADMSKWIIEAKSND